jgi:hypothetical protein
VRKIIHKVTIVLELVFLVCKIGGILAVGSISAILLGIALGKINV